MAFPAFADPLPLQVVSDPAAPLPVLRAAVYERALAHYGTAYVPIALFQTDAWPELPAPGESVQTSSILANMQRAVGEMVWRNDNPINGIHALPTWVDHRAAITPGRFPTFWTMPALRVAAGLPATKHFTPPNPPSTTDLTEEPSLANTQFLRKAERRISVPTADADVFGNPAITGQRARFQGFIYRCVAAGQWVRDNSAKPDILTNADDPPNCLPGYAPVSSPDYGQTRNGDIIGGPLGRHCCDELRAIVDLMRWTCRASGGGPGSTAYTHTNILPFDWRRRGDRGAGLIGAGGSGFSYAAAAADLAAAYAAAPIETTPFGFDGLNPVGYEDVFAYGYAEADAGATYAVCYAAKQVARWQATDLPAIARTVTWYVAGGTLNTFDANGDAIGDAIGNDELAELATTGPESGTESQSPWSGDIDHAPELADPGIPASGTASITLEYQSPFAFTSPDRKVMALAVFKWNIDGGFAYCSVTD